MRRRLALEGPQARFFSPTSPWNTALVASSPLDPSSTAMVAGLVQQVRQYGAGFNTTTWSVPIYTAGVDQATTRVTLDNPNRYLQRAWEAVPVPPAARPAAGTDRHLVVWQPASDTMWEFWHMDIQADGWHAEYGGRIVHASRSPGYYVTARDETGAVVEQSWWGATATGLPLVAGLVTMEEARCGAIDHALALALPNVRQGYIAWPAQRGDGKDPSPTAIPEGARLRLDPRLDLSELDMPPFTRMLARAAQRYGLIVRDGAGSVALYGEDPTPRGSNPWLQLSGNLKPWQFMPSFPWSRLQVLRSDLRAYPPQPTG
ncbi:MAG TPA: hypothetical protein VN756_09485 [Solirubrobacterales bacterium]|nr:hypothetical protein [Solirubrobacterales bacterium]